MARNGNALSSLEARRIAIAAQGFGTRRSGIVGRAGLLTAIQRLGLVQIDSVNVLVRSHYLPAFSRLGGYERTLLERLAYGRSRKLFEYWAHEASLLPLETYPLLRWRMERARRSIGVYSGVAQLARERPRFIVQVRKALEERGAMSASDFEGAKGLGGWWGWSDTKRALEYLFWAGEVTAAGRRNSFERVYDVVEHVLPAAILAAPVPAEAEAQRQLLLIAARALGVASESDLRDYFRLDARDAKARVAELVESGALLEAGIEGWRQPAYVDSRRARPRPKERSALLSPFDSLIWNRPRTSRLFGFDYHLEIYTPSHKRVHGYYVLPYLLDDALVARVDLKADRAAKRLLVHAVHFERGVAKDAVTERLALDLEAMAAWLELEAVSLPAAMDSRRYRAPRVRALP
ncbi:winged helix-turn-helix domain-containing protein [bacterium]|nr:MAG: winged helix-turn-helix domain-containing protein [bacterium]